MRDNHEHHRDDHRHHHHEGRFGRGPHDRHERGPRGGGPGRFFDGDDLRHVILQLISDKPRHGYEIIKLIETEAAGAYSPSPGIVYPTLTMLEEMGFAAVTAEGTRKLYAITEDGKRDLESSRARVEAIFTRMREAGQRHVHERPAPILRSMENLKMVLRMRAGQFSTEQMAGVTDIIDNAARQIERL